MRASDSARVAFTMALFLWVGTAAQPALAQNLPAPTLSITAETCSALLSWTHDNPDNLNIYNYQHRVRPEGAASWEGWNNVAGGATARNVAVKSYRPAGHHEYQVRVSAITLGSIIYSSSNTETAYLIHYNSRYCQEGGE